MSPTSYSPNHTHFPSQERPFRALYFLKPRELTSVSEPAAAAGGPAVRDFGFPDIRPLLDFFGFTQHETAFLFELNPSTISRRKKSSKPIGRLRSKLVLDLDALVAKGVRMFGSEKAFHTWLSVPNTALGGAEPLSYLKSPAGIVPIDALLDSFSWGNFS